MTNVYLMANPFNRFHSELAVCHTPSTVCTKCNYPVRCDESQLTCFWDIVYGARERALAAEHSVYWGEFSMATTLKTAEVLESLKLPFVVREMKRPTAKEIRNRYNIETDDFQLMLRWVKPSCSIDLVANDLLICDECGKIADAAWKLTGLKVLRHVAEPLGVFTVNQNRGVPPFATEEAKMKIEASSIRGIKFYKAGRLVG